MSSSSDGVAEAEPSPFSVDEEDTVSTTGLEPSPSSVDERGCAEESGEEQQGQTGIVGDQDGTPSAD